MKISSSRIPSNSSGAGPDDSAAKDNDRFRRLLNSKAQQEPDSQPHPEAEIPLSLEAPPPTPSGETPVIQPAVDVERLADEIAQQIARQNAGSTKNMEIQFQSTVLSGLRVELKSQETGLVVNFYTQSEEVGAALAGHFDELSRALRTKGFHPERLKVSLARPSSVPYSQPVAGSTTA